MRNKTQIVQRISAILMGSMFAFNLLSFIVKIQGSTVTIVNLCLISGLIFIRRTYLRDAFQKNRLADIIIRLTVLMSKVDSKEEFYQEILKESVGSVKGANRGSLILIREDGTLSFEAEIGFNMEKIKHLNITLEDTMLYKLSGGNISESMVIKNIASQNKAELGESEYNKMLLAGIGDLKYTISSPLIMNGHLYGMLNVDRTIDRKFTRSEVQLVEELSEQVSRILRLYELHENTLKTTKYDSLTNSLTRATFSSIMNNMMSLDMYSSTSFAIVYIDIDELKTMNDTHGHEVGDEYLKLFASGIRQHLSGEETIARFGGDEFVVLMLRTDQELERFHEECRQWFQAHPLAVGNNNYIVQYSYGSARYPIDGKAFNDLIQIADRKMYRCKQEHRSSKH